MKTLRSYLAVSVLSSILALAPAFADEAPSYGLLGDWGGSKPKMAEKGTTLSLSYSGEPSSILSGGLQKQTVYVGKANLIWDQELEPLLGVPSTLFHLYLTDARGKGPGQYTGDYQFASNINLPTYADTNSPSGFSTVPSLTRVYEVYLKKQLWDGKAHLLLGMYDVNSEFYISNPALVFLNSSFGIGTELVQPAVLSGLNSPSTYPQPAFGGKFQLNATDELYFQLAIMDAVAGDGILPNADSTPGNVVRFRGDDGLFVIAESGHQSKSYKYALGFWTYTQAYDTLLSNAAGSPVQRVSHGFYSLAEHEIIQDLWLFHRLGFASSDVNQVQANWAGGLVWNRPTAWWDNDQIGIGFTSIFMSSDYKATNTSENSETALELLYRFEPIAGLAVQPDLQYIINPASTPGTDDAFLALLRFDVSL